MAEQTRQPPSRPRRPRRESEPWSKPVALGGGWRLQYAKEAGEEFTQYRLLPPPNACRQGQPRDLPRITALDTLRVVPWLQRIFSAADGPRVFRPVACGEPGAVDRAQRELRAVDRQAKVWTEREIV